MLQGGADLPNERQYTEKQTDVLPDWLERGYLLVLPRQENGGRKTKDEIQ